MADSEAVVHHGGNEFFIGISPRGHALTAKTNGERGTAATPVELLLVAVGDCGEGGHRTVRHEVL